MTNAFAISRQQQVEPGQRREGVCGHQASLAPAAGSSDDRGGLFATRHMECWKEPLSAAAAQCPADAELQASAGLHVVPPRQPSLCARPSALELGALLLGSMFYKVLLLGPNEASGTDGTGGPTCISWPLLSPGLSPAYAWAQVAPWGPPPGGGSVLKVRKTPTTRG